MTENVSADHSHSFCDTGKYACLTYDLKGYAEDKLFD